MDLFLVRHAVAEENASQGCDERRALTPEGIKRFRREIPGLERMGVRFDRVMHSPLLRAQETAEILAPACDGELEVAHELATEPCEALLARIVSARVERLALVGHEPWMSQLLAWLVFGWKVYDSEAHAGLFDFQKGGVAHVIGEPRPGAMKLAAFYPPSSLRKLARR